VTPPKLSALALVGIRVGRLLMALGSHGSWLSRKA
jgi:hypothetical protein